MAILHWEQMHRLDIILMFRWIGRCQSIVTEMDLHCGTFSFNIGLVKGVCCSHLLYKFLCKCGNRLFLFYNPRRQTLITTLPLA